MKTRLTQLWESLRASYWFLPGIMALGATVLAGGTEVLDRALRIETVQALSWLYGGGPEGARAVLSTVAGSMITVAGVAFSITMVALVLASSQFGPRILRNFMRDRGNQFVLGTFIATFLYCLLALRTVRSVEGDPFVPHVSVTVAVVMALASVGVLIYFIDHVATSIQAPNVVARVGRDLDRAVDRTFAERDPESGEAGQEASEAPPRPRELEEEAPGVPADRSGYVQLVDEQGLVDVAAEADLTVSCHHRPGHFVVEGTPLVRVSPGERLDEDVADRIRECFLYGDTRTDIQDVDFAVKQLVEIAVRALSPGINDPFTAMNCVDRLASALARASRREPAPLWLTDEEGEPRVRFPRPRFPHLTDAAFDAIREHARSVTDVLARLVEALVALEVVVRRPEDRAALLSHVDRVAETASHGVGDRAGGRRIEALLRLLRARLEDVEDGEDDAEGDGAADAVRPAQG